VVTVVGASLCLCVFVCASTCECANVWVCVCAHVRACVRVCACVHSPSRVCVVRVRVSLFFLLSSCGRVERVRAFAGQRCVRHCSWSRFALDEAPNRSGTHAGEQCIRRT
jgi:hypothetical protein